MANIRMYKLGKRIFAILLAYVLVLPSLSAQETTPTLVNGSSEPQDIAQIAETPAYEVADPQQTRMQIEQLRREIEDIESNFNAFNSAIGERSYDLGLQLRNLGLYTEALEAFRRAEHILRVNNGIYAMEQIPVVEGMIDTNMRQQNWGEVNRDLDRLVWLYRRNDAEESPEFYEVMDDYAQYHLAAYFWGIDGRDLEHLLEAHDAYALMLQRNEASGLDYDPRVMEALVIINYSLMQYIDGDDFTKLAEVDALSSRKFGLENFLANSFRRGLDILQFGREVALQSGSVADLIHINLLESDWNQLFRKRFEAQNYLKEAWQLAAQIDQQDSFMFSQPHILPSQEFVGSLPRLGGQENLSELKLRMDIDEWGNARNVRLLTSDEEVEEKGLKGASFRALRSTRQARFRPAIVDGEPVLYNDFTQVIYVED